MQKLAVIGAGAWGTAIANLLARNGHEVLLWCFEQEVAEQINQTHCNKTYLPNVELFKNIRAVTDFSEFAEVAAIFSVIPVQHSKVTLQPLLKLGAAIAKIPLVICSKGIENQSLKLPSEFIAELLPHNPLVVMSGPNFADEVALGEAAITSIACADEQVGEQIIQLVANQNFKPVYCVDIVGAQLGGALKNIIAIAMGIAVGMELSESSKAAIMTKGLNEIGMISRALGGRKRTAMEPCGIGDLVLTCSSIKSRNMSLGVALGKGKTLKEIMAERKTVAEGVATTKAVKQIAQQHNLNLKICNLVYQILYADQPITAESFFV